MNVSKIDTGALHRDGGKWHIMSWSDGTIEQSLCGTLLLTDRKTIKAEDAPESELCPFCFPEGREG